MANIFEYDEDLATKGHDKLLKIEQSRRAFPDMLGLNVSITMVRRPSRPVFTPHIHPNSSSIKGIAMALVVFADNSKSYTAEEFGARAAALPAP